MNLSGNRDSIDKHVGLDLAVALAVAAWAFGAGEPSPGIWDALASAAGARPAEITCDSLWTTFAAGLLRLLPGGLGYSVLHLLGPLTLGLFTYLFAGAVQMMLPLFLRRQLAEVRSHRLIRWFLVLPVTVLFALSEPIWRLCLYFSPDTLHVLLAFLGFYGIVRFRRTLRKRFAILAFVSLGLLTAEDMLGIAFLGAAIGVLAHDAFALRSSEDPFAVTKMTLYAYLQRLLTVLALAGICLGAAVAALFFLANDGVEAAGGDGQAALIEFLLAYVKKVPAIASKGGWAYFLVLGTMPLAIAAVPLRRALDVEKILNYRLALCYIAAGFLAYSQLVNIPALRLWQSFRGSDPVGSPLMLASVAVASALTVALALSVLFVEVFFRRYKRLAQALFLDAPDNFVEGLDRTRKHRYFRPTWLATLAVPCVLVACTFPGRPNCTEFGMRRAVSDYLRLAADDCEGSPVAITDGSADAGLELELFRRGQSGFKALSMMGDRTPRETWLRRRGETKDSEDWTALGISAAAALRDWVRAKSDRSTNLTVQIGFELWRHDKLPMPPMGATAGRTDGFAPETKTNLVLRARELGERMYGLFQEGAPNATTDTELRRLWNFTLWRLARAARMRSDEADRAGDAALAQEETAFADRLDDANPAYQEVRRRTEWVPRQVHSRLSPREGLRFALRQADFTLASTYARQILTSNTNDFHANFAMGMYYVTAEQYSRAVKHLELAHAARPKEPSSLNNLATVELHLGRLDRALKHAEEALALAPDVPEIKRTAQRIKREIGKTAAVGARGGVQEGEDTP